MLELSRATMNATLLLRSMAQRGARRFPAHSVVMATDHKHLAVQCHRRSLVTNVLHPADHKRRSATLREILEHVPGKVMNLFIVIFTKDFFFFFFTYGFFFFLDLFFFFFFFFSTSSKVLVRVIYNAICPNWTNWTNPIVSPSSKYVKNLFFIQFITPRCGLFSKFRFFPLTSFRPAVLFLKAVSWPNLSTQLAFWLRSNSIRSLCTALARSSTRS
jgi:hypothetical protein